MTLQRTRQWGSLLFMGCGLLVGFVIGWKGHGQFRISPNAEVRKSYLQETGARSRRCAGRSNKFPARISKRLQQKGHPTTGMLSCRGYFLKDQDTRIIGTDTGEWRSGYESVSHFVHDDWVDWGNVRLSVDDAVIDSAGETAWLATTGEVSSAHSTRAMRFTAVLTRRNERWLFRQIEFQWDQRFLKLSDLLKREGWSLLKLR